MTSGRSRYICSIEESLVVATSVAKGLNRNAHARRILHREDRCPSGSAPGPARHVTTLSELGLPPVSPPNRPATERSRPEPLQRRPVDTLSWTGLGREVADRHHPREEAGSSNSHAFPQRSMTKDAEHPHFRPQAKSIAVLDLVIMPLVATVSTRHWTGEMRRHGFEALLLRSEWCIYARAHSRGFGHRSRVMVRSQTILELLLVIVSWKGLECFQRRWQ